MHEITYIVCLFSLYHLPILFHRPSPPRLEIPSRAERESIKLGGKVAAILKLPVEGSNDLDVCRMLCIPDEGRAESSARP